MVDKLMTENHQDPCSQEIAYLPGFEPERIEEDEKADTFLGEMPKTKQGQAEKPVVEVSESDTIVHIRVRSLRNSAEQVRLLMHDGSLVLRISEQETNAGLSPFFESQRPADDDIVLRLPEYVQIHKSMVTRDRDTLHIHIPKKPVGRPAAGAN